MRKTVRTTYETASGRNVRFLDTRNNVRMTRAEFVSAIEHNKSGYAENYYVRRQNGIKTPVSKPDGKKTNNLD